MAYTAIDDSSAHFQIDLYTGNGNDDLALTNDGNSDLQPDLVWIKSRSSGSLGHRLYDTSRGAAAGDLRTHGTNGDTVEDGDLESFDSDGFTIDDHGDINTADATFVAWQWKANGGTRVTFTESGDNPGGGHQANTTAGFSIVDYVGTGAAGTVSHGLGAAPEYVIIKARDRSDNWRIGSDFLSSWGYNIAIDVTNAEWSNSGVFNSTAPTSSVFSVGSDGATNANGEKNIAYCFKSIQGFSQSGKYVGNGSNVGPFVYTGFNPAWIMIKKIAAVEDWGIVDNKRSSSDGNNVIDRFLYANAATAEPSTQTPVDLVSNGFKLRSNDNKWNADGSAYLYLSFAHQPFVTSGGVPATAR